MRAMKIWKLSSSRFLMAAIAMVCFASYAVAGELKLAHFHVDASPPIGSPLAYDPCVEITEPLSFHGVILLGDEAPIVLGVVDWLGVANEANEYWRAQLAAAVGTTADRVALHAVHQHDAPRCDLSAAHLLAEYGQADAYYDIPWIRDIIGQTCEAAKQSLEAAIVIDQVGVGHAEVVDVASNRRLLDDSGKVYATRYTACADPLLRAAPTGVVDKTLRSVSFWSAKQPVMVLTYFATHPQSYYRTGQANPDFPGYARDKRAADSGVPHVHFNGAGGNIGAGKWNDGSRENRAVLAGKMEIAMRSAFDRSDKFPVSGGDIQWQSVNVRLPLGRHLDEAKLLELLAAEQTSSTERLTAAKHLAWLRRSRYGHKVDIQCLSVGEAKILHMPGELFVEYQLKAAEMRPDAFVAMAAYGEYGCGYIGTQVAYGQGGYETSDRASRVSAETEKILVEAMQTLLQ